MGIRAPAVKAHMSKSTKFYLLLTEHETAQKRLENHYNSRKEYGTFLFRNCVKFSVCGSHTPIPALLVKFDVHKFYML